MLFLQTLLATLIATSFGLPTPHESKRDLITLDVDPSISIDLLKNLCLGIAVCNPVSVVHNEK
ncbi:hypothetical protein VTL71DRAFT_10277 [Oculimacula yallundae]|uniref:Uncharacterized protein n=1 Tax=Oculimacula yallundae TaxID=86028 RepID=A0ABR4CUA5_9HELO